MVIIIPAPVESLSMNDKTTMTLRVSHYDGDAPEPADDLVLWRYLDFPKFLDLLTTSTLKMPRASSMEDGYEGVLGEADVDARLRAWKRRGEPSYLRQASWNMELKATFFWRDRTYVSCWNSFPTENAGLWRIYGDDKGLVIKTTWKRLKESLNASDCVETVFYGHVEYKNFATDAADSESYTDQYFSKRIEFAHENEFRLVAHDSSREHNYNDDDPTELPKFATVACDLNILIDELIISPRLGGWVKKSVAETSQKFGGDWRVRQSNLCVAPERTSMKF